MLSQSGAEGYFNKALVGNVIAAYLKLELNNNTFVCDGKRYTSVQLVEYIEGCIGSLISHENYNFDVCELQGQTIVTLLSLPTRNARTLHTSQGYVPVSSLVSRIKNRIDLVRRSTLGMGGDEVLQFSPEQVVSVLMDCILAKTEDEIEAFFNRYTNLTVKYLGGDLWSNGDVAITFEELRGLVDFGVFNEDTEFLNVVVQECTGLNVSCSEDVSYASSAQ
jgi:hypothetical protein